MTQITQIAQLLTQKQELFARFAATTQEMLDCPRDQLEEHLARRESLMGEIGALDRSVARLREQSGLEDEIRGAISGTAHWDSLSQEVQPLYQQAAATRTLVSRLAETEAQVSLRLRLEQEQILEQIKSSSRSSTAQAARFLSSDDLLPQPGSITKV